MDARLQEKLQILAGDRGKPSDHALRKGEIANIQELIAQLRDSTTLIRNSLIQVQQNVNTVTDEVNALSERLVQTESDLAAIEERVTDIDSSLNGIEDRIALAESALDEILNTDLGEINNSIQAIQDQLNNITTAVSAVIINDITSSPVSGAPTEAEFNALQTDVVNLHQSLIDMKAAIGS